MIKAADVFFSLFQVLPLHALAVGGGVRASDEKLYNFGENLHHYFRKKIWTRRG